MAVKVFCDLPVLGGYTGNPASGFSMDVHYNVYDSENGPDGGPRNFADTVSMNFDIGSFPQQVYATAFASICAACANYGYPIPTKYDVYLYAPHILAEFIPDIPPLA